MGERVEWRGGVDWVRQERPWEIIRRLGAKPEYVHTETCEAERNEQTRADADASTGQPFTPIKSATLVGGTCRDCCETRWPHAKYGSQPKRSNRSACRAFMGRRDETMTPVHEQIRITACAMALFAPPAHCRLVWDYLTVPFPHQTACDGV